MSPVSRNRRPSSAAAAAPTELFPLEAGPSSATVIREAGWAGIAPRIARPRRDPAAAPAPRSARSGLLERLDAFEERVGRVERRRPAVDVDRERRERATVPPEQVPGDRSRAFVEQASRETDHRSGRFEHAGVADRVDE